jgi:hypothetical protein
MDLQDILAYKAAEKERQSDSLLNAGIAAGAGGGALAGMLAGQPVHMMGNALNAGRDALAARQGLSAVRKPMRALKPGPRMAGGLVGMIVGGGLGAGVAAAARQNNPAADILGKVASGGDLTVQDKMIIEDMVSDYYKTQGIA